jgi:hypothetical protein
LQARALEGTFGSNRVSDDLKEASNAFRADNTNEWVALSVKGTKNYLVVDTAFIPVEA